MSLTKSGVLTDSSFFYGRVLFTDYNGINLGGNIMILFTILLSIICVLAIIAFVIGGGFMIVFGDVLIFALIIVGIVRYLKKHKNKDGV